MHSKSPGYIPGDRWGVCDVCGYDFRMSELRLRWDNKLVCSRDFETRHPLDFFRVQPDKETPEGEIRVPPTDNEPLICTVIGSQAIVDYAVVDCVTVEQDFGYRDVL